MKIKIMFVVGARPNFMKVAPVYKKALLNKDSLISLLCHTGQHYDNKMSDIFFKELNIPPPHYSLGAGSGSHAEQTAKIMVEFEKVLLNEKPDLVVVAGDVNSTIACSLTASKIGIKTAHIESGLRSFDRSMPEEINRLLTDSISDLLFVTEESGMRNLFAEGVNKEKIFFVGNTMIDSLVEFFPLIADSAVYERNGIEPGSYILITMHRPSNVDSQEFLRSFFSLLGELTSDRKIIFPIHPRTRRNIVDFSIPVPGNVIFIDPAGYVDFLALMKSAVFVMTDSGGIQEETTYLGVQCITIRNNTERPVTVDIGTNQLAGTDFNNIKNIASEVLNGKIKKGSIPPLWDGNASDRIIQIFLNKLG